MRIMQSLLCMCFSPVYVLQSLCEGVFTSLKLIFKKYIKISLSYHKHKNVLCMFLNSSSFFFQTNIFFNKNLSLIQYFKYAFGCFKSTESCDSCKLQEIKKSLKFSKYTIQLHRKSFNLCVLCKAYNVCVLVMSMFYKAFVTDLFFFFETYIQRYLKI